MALDLRISRSWCIELNLPHETTNICMRVWLHDCHTMSSKILPSMAYTLRNNNWRYSAGDIWCREEVPFDHYLYSVILLIALHLWHWCELFIFDVEHFGHNQLPVFFSASIFFATVWIVPTAGFKLSRAVNEAKKSAFVKSTAGAVAIAVRSCVDFGSVSTTSVRTETWERSLSLPEFIFCFFSLRSLVSLCSRLDFLLPFFLLRLSKSLSESESCRLFFSMEEFFCSLATRSPWWSILRYKWSYKFDIWMIAQNSVRHTIGGTTTISCLTVSQCMIF